MSAPSSDPEPRKLSTLDATLLVMGGIIGVGIFFTPQSVAERAGAPWAFLSLWVFGGLIAICAAFTFAELAASFPRSGGWFVFLREAFGPLPAFLFAWVVLFVISTGAMAAVTGFCATMLHSVFPRAIGEAGSASHRAVAVGIIVGLTAITLRGVKSAALVQNLCMATKLVAIAGLVLGGLLLADVATGPAVAGPLELPSVSARGLVSALLPIFFSYGGWQLVCYIAPQVERPERTLPLAIIGGVAGVIVVYVVANLAFLRVLGLEGIAADGAFSSTLARSAFGATGERLLALGMAISAIGVCAVNVIVTPWLYVAMAKEGLFFSRFARLHPTTGAPVLALVTQAAVMLVYLFATTIQYLVDSVVFVEWLFHGLAAIALLRIRALRPEVPRPFRSPLYPLAPLVYLAAAVLVVAGTLWQADAATKYTGLAIVAVGAAIYGPWRRALAR